VAQERPSTESFSCLQGEHGQQMEEIRRKTNAVRRRTEGGEEQPIAVCTDIDPSPSPTRYVAFSGTPTPYVPL